MPKIVDFLSDLRGNHHSSLAFGPGNLRNGIDEDIRLQDLVRSRLDDSLPFHAHIVDFASLARPVISLEWLCGEMTDADDACRFLISNLDEDEPVPLMGLLMLDNTPVEVVRGAVPFIEIS